MKVKILLLTLLIFSGSVLYADFLADPSHRIYKYFTIWQDKGYIKQLPIIRPYPMQVMKKFLAEVKEKGEPQDREIAERYYRLITEPGAELIKGKELPSPIYYSIIGGLITDFKDMYWYAGAQVDTSGLMLNDIISYSGKLSFAVQNSIWNPFFPEYQKTLFVDDYNSGGAAAGSLDIGHFGQGGFFIGNDRFYFSAGFWRSSYGPFFEDGPVVGPQAPAAGHFGLTYRGEWVTVSTLFLDLIARRYAQKLSTGSMPYELRGFGSTDNVMKYLIIHTISIQPADWIDIGLMQSVLGGGALHPQFLIPIQYVFYMQEQAGGYNNSQIGIFMQLRLPANIGINFQFFGDDWDMFSQMGNGVNLNSAQDKYAIQAGVSWSPGYSVFKRLSLEYQIISQYMYTHVGQMPTGSAQSNLPYLNYTNNGVNLGSAMEPNSDRIALKAYMTPVSWLDIDVFATFMRHGNASNGVYDDQGRLIGDGTIWDDGWDYKGNVTFYTSSRTLNQTTLEYTLQAGFEAGFNFPFKYVELTFKLGYIFQQIWNRSATIVDGTATATAMGPQPGVNATNNFVYVKTEIKF